MDFIICARGISRYVEGELVGGFGIKVNRIWINREILLELKKEFGEGNEELVKVVEQIEQGGKTMEEFIQEFKRVARESGYERRVLVEKFKKRMNKVIRRKLMEAKRPPTSIEQ